MKWYYWLLIVAAVVAGLAYYFRDKLKAMLPGAKAPKTPADEEAPEYTDLENSEETPPEDGGGTPTGTEEGMEPTTPEDEGYLMDDGVSGGETIEETQSKRTPTSPAGSGGAKKTYAPAVGGGSSKAPDGSAWEYQSMAKGDFLNFSSPKLAK